MKTQIINNIEKEFGKIGLPTNIANNIIYNLSTDNLNNIDKCILIRLIRDNELQKVIENRNNDYSKIRNQKIKEIKNSLKSYIKTNTPYCNCGEKSHPLSIRKFGKNATINRIKGLFYCERCEKIIENNIDTTKQPITANPQPITEDSSINIEVDFFEGCTPKTTKIIKMLVKEFGFSPLGFDVNIGKKLQRKGHQEIYYMGKPISNNMASIVMENII